MPSFEGDQHDAIVEFDDQRVYVRLATSPDNAIFYLASESQDTATDTIFSSSPDQLAEIYEAARMAVIARAADAAGVMGIASDLISAAHLYVSANRANSLLESIAPKVLTGMLTARFSVSPTELLTALDDYSDTLDQTTFVSETVLAATAIMQDSARYVSIAIKNDFLSLPLSAKLPVVDLNSEHDLAALVEDMMKSMAYATQIAQVFAIGPNGGTGFWSDLGLFWRNVLIDTAVETGVSVSLDDTIMEGVLSSLFDGVGLIAEASPAEAQRLLENLQNVANALTSSTNVPVPNVEPSNFLNHDSSTGPVPDTSDPDDPDATDAGNNFVAATELPATRQSIDGSVGASDTADFFRLIARDAGLLSIDLNNVYSDLALRAYSSRGVLVAESDRPEDSREFLRLQVTAGQEVVLGVHAIDAFSTYELEIFYDRFEGDAEAQLLGFLTEDIAADDTNKHLVLDYSNSSDGLVATGIEFRNISLGHLLPEWEEIISLSDGSENRIIMSGFKSFDITGSNSDDQISGIARGGAVRGGSIDHVFRGLLGNDTLQGGYGDDLIEGGEGDDRLSGGGVGNDTLLGGQGNDYLDIGSLFYSNYIDGGSGTDTAVFNANRETANVSVVFDPKSPTPLALWNGTVVANVEAFEVFKTGSGDDELSWKFYDDSLIDQWLFLGDGNDKITLDFSEFDNGISFLKASYNSMFSASLVGDDFGKPQYAGHQLLSAIDSAENFIVYGGGGDDAFFTEAGDDRLVGGFGSDNLAGGAGDDTLVSTGGKDLLFGGEDVDIIFLTGNSYHTASNVAFNVSSDTQVGTQTRINLEGLVRIKAVTDGGADADIVQLSGEGDAFFLHDAFSGFHSSVALTEDYVGNESAARFANIEEIRSMGGDDIIDLTSPDYSLAGISMYIDGGEGNDVIWGSDADENIFGGNGSDTIFGGIGTDVLTGGSGADVFEFTRTSTETSVTDFKITEGDKLHFYNAGEAEFDASSVALTGRGIGISYTDTASGTIHYISIDLAPDTAAFTATVSEILDALEIL